MSNAGLKTKKPTAREKRVSARELGAVLFHLAKLVGSRPTNNQRISEALTEASKILESFGSAPFLDAFKEREARPDRAVRGEETELSDLPLERVRDIVRDLHAPRRALIDLATSRFGLSRALLERKSTEGIRDELMTAIEHETSISIISDVARRGA